MLQIPEFVPVEKLSYSQALSELESILRKMQSDDLLAAYTRRATQLLTECRSRLVATDKELQSILNPQG